MRLKGTIVVEASVIMPLFSIIIVVLVMTGMAMSDEVIKEYAYLQAAMEYEANEGLSPEDLYKRVDNYISERTLTQTHSYKEFEQTVEKDGIVKENRQADFIRKINAVAKLKEVILE